MTDGSFARKMPDVSVVVVVYNMEREAPRTLRSLSAAYQRNIAADDYEVIVVDNGSSPPFDASVIDNLEGNFRIIRINPAPSSPAHALNVGLAAARGDVIGVMIDGARMVTPGLLHFARCGVGLYRRAVVATTGWYLGRDQQRWAVDGDYDQVREDALLASINWPEDGYRLFEIAAPDETTVDGWFGPFSESNALFLSRESWTLMGGVDERFDVPGGGFLNLDLMSRALDLPDRKFVVLLGEGAFHQLHGGIATNANHQAISDAVNNWRTQYETIRGHPWEPPNPADRTYIGALPPAPLAHFARSVIEPVGAPPLGSSFDKNLWRLAPCSPPEDPTVAALVALAEGEFRARRFAVATMVARMARKYAPDDTSLQNILSTAAAWLRGAGKPEDLTPAEWARLHLARGKVYAILGQNEDAESSFRAAIQLDDDLVEAYLAITTLRMPGKSYFGLLERLHASVVPKTYLEIGVATGLSIALARPPTRAIGVDPSPSIKCPFSTETHIFCETSDDFFAQQKLPALLDGDPLPLAFIDGLHEFSQSLKDFLNVEKFCARESIILLHDTLPFDELTQRPERQRRFYTGNVWKTVLCLKLFRPDLEIFTIPAKPSGLTIITNLDPTSKTLAENFDEAIARFADAPYHELEADPGASLNLVPNDWDLIAPRLRSSFVSNAR